MPALAPRIPAILGGTALAGLILVGTASAAETWVPPAPSSPVTDQAGVLSPEARTSLARRLTRYEADSGHQLVVYLARTSGEVPLEEFAVKSFAAWKLGQVGRDDGLAVFAMTDDHTVRIEVGYGLESSVTDLAAASVIRTTMIPLIKAGKWDDAVAQGVESIVDTIEARPGALPADDGDADPDELPELGLPAKIAAGVLAALFLVFLILRPRSALGLLFMIGRFGLGGGGGGGGGFRGGGGRSGGGGASGRW